MPRAVALLLFIKALFVKDRSSSGMHPKSASRLADRLWHSRRTKMSEVRAITSTTGHQYEEAAIGRESS